jgi:hypothetical protein
MESAALMQIDHGPRGGGGAVMARQAGRRGGKAKAATGCDELGGARCSQARRAPLIHAKVEARAARCGFDMQRKTGNRWRGRRSCRTRRSGQNWIGASTSASGSVLPVASLARFRRRVRVQGNRPRTSRLRARDAGAK